MTWLFRWCYTVSEFQDVGCRAHGMDMTARVDDRPRRSGERAVPAYSAPVDHAASYPGAELGMPAEGSGSMAPWGRRLVAVVIDWLLCELIAVGLLGTRLTAAAGSTSSGSWWPLVVFAAENLLLVATTGTTVGHRLLGLQVRQVGPGLYPVQVAVRTVLLCLFVPAVLTSRDGRGWHDRVAGTVIVRR